MGVIAVMMMWTATITILGWSWDLFSFVGSEALVEIVLVYFNTVAEFSADEDAVQVGDLPKIGVDGFALVENQPHPAEKLTVVLVFPVLGVEL